MTVPLQMIWLVAMTAAVVISAVVTFSVMVVMVAAHIGIKTKVACQQIRNGCISVTAAATVKGNTCLLESHLGTAADAAADQNIGL